LTAPGRPSRIRNDPTTDLPQLTSSSFEFRLEQPVDAAAIELLHDVTMGPGRFVRAAYRLREGVPHDPSLSFVAMSGGRLIGSVRLTPITIGGRAALLLGPLAVLGDYAGQGAGKALVRMGIDAARRAGHKVVLLVGDEPYYGPLGFSRAPPGSITLPAPADPRRILLAGLAPGALEGAKGQAERAG
jgi:predicted N-acetyltransferase YhbS